MLTTAISMAQISRIVNYSEVQDKEYVVKKKGLYFVLRCALNPDNMIRHQFCQHPMDEGRAKKHLANPSIHDPPCHLAAGIRQPRRGSGYNETVIFLALGYRGM